VVNSPTTWTYKEAYMPQIRIQEELLAYAILDEDKMCIVLRFAHVSGDGGDVRLHFKAVGTAKEAYRLIEALPGCTIDCWGITTDGVTYDKK
jgi:hypothetical protein